MPSGKRTTTGGIIALLGIGTLVAITVMASRAGAKKLRGAIDEILYYHTGLTNWGQLQPDTEVPLGTPVHFAPLWINKSNQPIVGHIDLTITDPSGISYLPEAIAQQDKEAQPGNGYYVQFAPFSPQRLGPHQLKVELSSEGQALDKKMMSFTVVP